MDARVLEIADRVAPLEFFPSVPSNFVLQEAGVVPAGTVLGASVDLYCLDDANRRALFAELPDGVDPAGAPFFYLTQYQQALRLYAVAYETLHERPPTSPTRCYVGHSPALRLHAAEARALDQVDGVRSISEPTS